MASLLGIATELSVDARKAHTTLGFDVAENNADDTATIPFPTVPIIDALNVVRFADVHHYYTSKAEPLVIIEAGNELVRDR